MNKKVVKVFGKTNYLLGEDANGERYYLQAASWDSDWYWGGGYVETFTNNRAPQLSRDISSHSHFNSMFFEGRGCAFDQFKAFFTTTPFTDSEIWKICELMKSFYTARAYSDMLHTGGAHYTSNPASETIKNEREYKRINDIVIPAIMSELYAIMSGDNN